MATATRSRSRTNRRKRSSLSKPTKVSARLELFSDREFLSLLVDFMGPDGYADAKEIAERIFPAEMKNGASRNAIGAVSLRLAWMAKFGVAEQEKKNNKPVAFKWTLTPEGELFVRGKLSKAMEQRLGNLKENELLELQHSVVTLWSRSSPVTSKLMSREWRWGTSKLRR